MSELADFLLFLRVEKHISVLTIRGYRSTLSSVLKFCLPGLQNNFILWNLVHSFELERPLRPVSPPAWDLVKVLLFLRVLCRLVLFLLSLTTAKHVGELQVVSFWVAFQGDDLSLFYLPEFVTKTESELNPIPGSF